MFPLSHTLRSSLCTGILLGLAVSGLRADDNSVPEFPQTQNGEIPQNLLPFEPLKKQSPEAASQIEAGAHFMNGVVLEKRGKFQEAMREYARAIQTDPQAVEAYRALIVLNIRFNRAEAAQGLLVEALKHAPDDSQLLHLLGALLQQRSQIVQAIGAYEKALESPKIEKFSQEHTLLILELGPLYQRAGMTEKAAETFETILQVFKQPERYGLNQQAVKLLLSDESLSYDTAGQIFLEAKKYTLALEAFNRAAENPRLKKEEISFFKSKIYLAQKKPQKALKELQPYLDKKLQSQGLKPYQLLSEIYTALKREQEIEPKLEELLKQNEANNFILYALADLYRQRDENAKAIDLYLKAIGRGADPEGYKGLMDVYYSEERANDWLGALSGLLGLGKNVEGIEDQFKQVSDDKAFMKKLVTAAREQKEAGSRKFNFPESYIIGRLSAASKQTEYVVEFYQMAMDFRPTQRPRLTGELAQYLTQEEEHQLAADLLEKAMNSPGNERLKQAYGQMLFRTLFSLSFDQEEAGDRQKALATIIRAQEVVPDNLLLDYRRGWLEYRNTHAQKAIQIFKDLINKRDFRTLEEGSQLQDILKQSHFLLSAILVQEGDLAAGQKILESVYEHDPEDPSVNNDLGYLYADQNVKLEQAEKMIRLAIKAEPENHAYLDSMGWVLYRRGKLDEALDYLLKAVAGSEDGDATLWDHLADVYHKMDNQPKAKESWETALKQAEADKQPDQDLIKKIRTKLGLPTKSDPITAPKPDTPTD